MGDFTWHVSDGEHLPISLSSAQNPGPVWMLGPNGRKWREDNYEGYGVFGGKNAHDALEEWNKGLTNDTRSGVEMSLRPFGSHFYPTEVPFPVKFSFDPDAVYEELPAAICATHDESLITTESFIVRLDNGPTLCDQDELEQFWIALARQMFPEDADKSDETMLDWCNDEMYDNLLSIRGRASELGATLEYVGWEKSIHGLVKDMVGLDGFRIGHVSGLEETDVEDLRRYAEVFDNGMFAGFGAYMAVYEAQVRLFRENQPLDAKPFFDNPESLQGHMTMSRMLGTPIDESVIFQAGHHAGALAQWRREEMGIEISSSSTMNPFKDALNKKLW